MYKNDYEHISSNIVKNAKNFKILNNLNVNNILLNGFLNLKKFIIEDINYRIFHNYEKDVILASIEKNKRFPRLEPIIKMHKNPIGFRKIVRMHNGFYTKPLAQKLGKILTKMCKEIQKHLNTSIVIDSYIIPLCDIKELPNDNFICLSADICEMYPNINREWVKDAIFKFGLILKYSIDFIFSPKNVLIFVKIIYMFQLTII